MMVIFSLILALLLLTGIIYALRHHQERTRQQLVAREQPLPPLAEDTNVADSAQPPHGTSPESQPAPAPQAAPESGVKEAEQESIVAPTPARQNPAAKKPDWRQVCQALRDQGRFEEALSVCQQAWPQWQSFDYAARVLRAAIRQTTNRPAEHQHWLRRLHALAAQASFLHDRVDGLPAPTWQQLAQRFTHQQVADLDMPWPQIGYQQLRLLTKSDRKQLVQLLGEPETHQSARIFHDKQWLTSIS